MDRNPFRVLYYWFNPIIHLVMRPTLRLVDAHNHPIRGGVVAAIVALLTHYLIAFPFAWDGGVAATLAAIKPIVHIAFGVVALSNLGIGLARYFSGQYGDRSECS